MRSITEEEKKELNNILIIPAIEEILKNAQLCIFIKELKSVTLARKLTAAVGNTLRLNKIQVSPSLFKNLESIFIQILTGLKARKHEFLFYFKQHAVKNYKNALMERSKTIKDILGDSISRSLEALGLASSFRKIDLELEINDFNNFLKEIDGLRSTFVSWWSVIGLLLILKLPLSLLLDSYYDSSLEVRLNFLIDNIFFFFIGVCILNWRLKWFAHALDLLSVEAKKNTTSLDSSLELVDIVDFSTYKALDSIYVPSWVSDEAKQYHHQETLTQSEQKFHNQRLRFKMGSIKKLFTPLVRSLMVSSNPVWFGTYVIMGDGKTLPPSKIYKINFPVKNVYWAFFNENALKNQGLSENSREWKNYQARLESGQVVPAQGHPGIKLLKPPVLSQVRINAQNFGPRLFAWSIKKLDVVYRLLGSECAIQMSSDGRQHRLIDFYWHVSKGPGH